MKKTLFTILTIALALSLCAAWTPALAAETEAEGGTSYELLLPTSYEQYLELSSPSDIAFCEKYMAIAEGNRIYLFDRVAEQYKLYEHTSNNPVSRLNFYESDGAVYLFFIENGPINVYYIDCTAEILAPATNTGITCSSFLIAGNDFYYSSTADFVSVYRRTLDGLTFAQDVVDLTPELPDDSRPVNPITPAFAYCGDTVYFSLNSIIYSVSGNEATPEPWNIPSSILSFTIANSTVYYSTTASTKSFYTYTTAEKVVTENGDPVINVPSIKLYNGAIYYICGNSIRSINASDGSFTDYIITKYSDRNNRISEATSLSVSLPYLVISDAGNRRISLYKITDETYTEVGELNYIPATVCAGDESFVVADNTAERLYIYSYEGILLQTLEIGASITDIAYYFDTYYVLMDGQGYHCTVTQAAGGEFTCNLSAVSYSFSYDSIACDLNGNLYLMNNGAVYPVHATNFLSKNVGESLHTFGSEAKLLRADYEGNLYALTNTSIIRFSPKSNSITSYDFSNGLSSLVYSETALSALSFAFGYEDDTVYILSDGFIAAARGLNVSSLNNLSGTEAHGAVFDDLPDEAFAQNRLVTANAGTVCVGIGLSSLEEEAALLDCGEYYRAEEPRTGVALAETDYGVLALFYGEEVENEFVVTRTYELCLLLKGSGYTYPDAVQSPSYTAATLSNDAGLYKYPAMRTSAPTGEENDPYEYAAFCRLADLSKGTRVTVLSVLTPESGVLDCGSYAFVRCDGADGVRYGFVPESYLVPAAQTGSAGTTQFVWRNLERGASVTLANISDASDEITLENEELLRVLTAPDEDGRVLVSYAADEKEYRGTIDHELLVHPDPALAISILVLVPVVAAAVLLSACYLIFRKQPTLQ